MRLVSITCVKNEDDIVEAFIRHTATLVDHLVVLDNGSTDETRDILETLQHNDFPLHIIDDPSPGYWQWMRMTRLMREFAVTYYDADWIVPLDVDEFVVTNGSELSDLLGQPTEQPRSILWRTYVPDPTDQPGELNPARRLRHRLVVEATPREKTIVPRQVAKQSNVIITQGNHAVWMEDHRLKPVPIEDAYLAHIPVRSPTQFASKIAIGHLQYLAMYEREDRWGWHYRIPYELLKADPAKFAKSLREAALRFAVPAENDFVPETVIDPIPYRGGELSFTPTAKEEVQSLRLVLEYAENLAQQYAEQSKHLLSILKDNDGSE
jgi:glycosyltransferase involved in cell wall biosynthesis